MLELNNYIPIKISGGIDDLMISWMDASVLSLNAPMLSHSVKKYKSQIPDFSFINTTPEFLQATAAESNSIAPSGFIFHVSRCGSTLLSNVLQLQNANIVVSEAGIINSILEYYVLCSNADQRKYLIELLKAVISIYGTPRTHEQSNLFIKFSSWNSLLIDVITALWPSTPCIGVFREPYKVCESILIKRVGWMNFYTHSAMRSNLLNTTENPSFIEFTVSILSSIYNSLSQISESAIFIEYSHDSMENIHKMLSHFNLEPSAIEWGKIKSSTVIYSKDQNKNIEFTPQKSTFRLTKDVEKLIETYLIPAYIKLQSFV